MFHGLREIFELNFTKTQWLGESLKKKLGNKIDQYYLKNRFKFVTQKCLQLWLRFLWKN